MPKVRLSFFVVDNLYNPRMDFNPMMTVPEKAQAGVYGKCVLYQT